MINSKTFIHFLDPTLQGILATSRALGDYPLKDQKLITAEPDVLHFDLAKVRAPRFALLASDGLWDALSNDAAAAFLGGNSIEKNWLEF